jgi:archaellum component FlaD/FlaE
MNKPDNLIFNFVLHYITLKGNDKTGDIDDRRKLINADTGNAVNSGNENNAETDSDLKKDSNQTDDSENKKNLSEETTNDGKFDRTENKKKRINGEHNSDVVQDDGKNVGSIDAGQNKDSERRTRFSAEITIQPKAYFQAGTEAVVMMVCMKIK